MAVFRNCRNIMKKAIFAVASLIMAVSCTEIEIPVFRAEDSALCFSAQSSQFSLKGVTQEWTEVRLDVTLIGPKMPVDRQFSVRVAPADGNTAVEGVDFKIVEHVVRADALNGQVTLLLKLFDEGTSRLRTTLEIVPNETFGVGYPAYVKTVVEWSQEYVRPELGVWRYWYTYFCHGYSKTLHELILQALGPEVEFYTASASYSRENPALTLKMPTWWYEASRTLYQTVKEYDKAHPGAPLMHSDDFEAYNSYNTAVGEGEKPEKIPTVLETLMTL